MVSSNFCINFAGMVETNKLVQREVKQSQESIITAYSVNPLYLEHLANNLKPAFDWLSNSKDFANENGKNILAAFIFYKYLVLSDSSNLDIKILQHIAKSIDIYPFDSKYTESLTEMQLDDLVEEDNISLFKDFIAQTQKKLTLEKFEAQFHKFESDVLDPEEYSFNTLAQIQKHYEVDQDYQYLMVTNKNANINTGYEMNKIQDIIALAIKTLVAKSDSCGQEFINNEPNFIAIKRPLERRFSIIIRPTNSITIGVESSNGKISTQFNLTQNKLVAQKTVKTRDKRKIVAIQTEISILEKWKTYETNFMDILPGLSFFPFQKMTYKFKDNYGQLGFINDLKETDLFEAIQKYKFSIFEKFELIFQSLYVGALSEIIGYSNVDARPENFLFERTSEGRPRIYICDPGGFFNSNASQTDVYIFLAMAEHSPKEEYVKISDRRLSVDYNLQIRKRLCFYLFGAIVFEIITKTLPHLESNKIFTPKFPQPPNLLNKKDLQRFSSGTNNSGLSSKTTCDLLNMIASMVQQEPTKRISCIEAFENIGKIIANDPILNKHFSSLKEYSGPWQKPEPVSIVPSVVCSPASSTSIAREVKQPDVIAKSAKPDFFTHLVDNMKPAFDWFKTLQGFDLKNCRDVDVLAAFIFQKYVTDIDIKLLNRMVQSIESYKRGFNWAESLSVSNIQLEDLEDEVNKDRFNAFIKQIQTKLTPKEFNVLFQKFEKEVLDIENASFKKQQSFDANETVFV